MQELLGVQSMRSDNGGTPGQNGYSGGKRGSPFQAGPFAERPFTEEGDVDSTPQWGRWDPGPEELPLPWQDLGFRHPSLFTVQLRRGVPANSTSGKGKSAGSASRAEALHVPETHGI